MTQDVDLSVLVEFGREREFVAQVLSKYQGLFEDAEEIAIESRVLPIVVDEVPADLSLACFSFEEDMINRGSSFEFDDGMSLFTISAEDLIVMKAVSGRPIDWQDVEGVVVKQRERLDMPAALTRLEELRELAEPDAVRRLESLLA